MNSCDVSPSYRYFDAILPLGSSTISLGLSMFSQANNVLIVPLAFATSILLVPASVQYNLFVNQS